MPDTAENQQRWQHKTISLDYGLKRISKTMEFADISLVAGGKQFKAHRLIVAARIPVLATKLYGKETGVLKSRFDLNEISAAGLKILLEYIYTDEIGPMDQDTLFEAYDAATKFNQNGLLDACIEKIASFEITFENIFSLLNTMAGPFVQVIPSLKNQCLEFAKLNAVTLLESECIMEANPAALLLLFKEKCFVNVARATLIEHIIRWAVRGIENHNYKEVRYVLLPQESGETSLLAHLGIEKLTGPELGAFIKKYKGLLEDDELRMFLIHTTDETEELPEWVKKNQN